MNVTPPAATLRHPDSDLIDSLGGAAEVARRLGYDSASGGSQRVQNWKYRGIPEVVRLRRPDIFGTPPAQGADPDANRIVPVEGA